jgi:hypothetical protein
LDLKLFPNFFKQAVRQVKGYMELTRHFVAINLKLFTSLTASFRCMNRGL